MIKIRLSRNGKKKNPFFNIIVIDSRKSRNGKFIECLGYYNSFLFSKNKKFFYISPNRLRFWKKLGIQISYSVKRLIRNFKIYKNLI